MIDDNCSNHRHNETGERGALCPPHPHFDWAISGKIRTNSGRIWAKDSGKTIFFLLVETFCPMYVNVSFRSS